MKFQCHMTNKKSITRGMVNSDTDILWTLNGAIWKNFDNEHWNWEIYGYTANIELYRILHYLYVEHITLIKCTIGKRSRRY